MVTLVWSSDAIFRSFYRRSGQGQVKKVQIFKFINVDKKGIYLDQFWLRNLMVSFVFFFGGGVKRPPPPRSRAG